MGAVVYVSHRVVPLPPGVEERGTLGLRAFERQLAWLKRLGVRFVSMGDLRAWLRGERGLPRRAAVLTFDDAYACIAEHVLPVLEREGVPLTVFVVAGLMGRTSSLYAQKGGAPHRHLDAGELRELGGSGLAEFGAHGYLHLDLTQASERELERETAEARERLEDALGTQVRAFAYPYGRASEAAVEAVRRSGYELAFTTQKARLDRNRASLWRLPRVGWGRRSTTLKLVKYHWLPGPGPDAQGSPPAPR